jgi:hypothetical protein
MTDYSCSLNSSRDIVNILAPVPMEGQVYFSLFLVSGHPKVLQIAKHKSFSLLAFVGIALSKIN